MMLSIKKLVSSYPQLKLHIETQIGSVVLMAYDQFIEFSYRDDVSVHLAVE